MTTEAACAELVSRLKRIHVLGTVNGLLGWDEQVNLPPDSADLRAEQLALMAEVQHAAASDPRIGELLVELEGRDGPAASAKASAPKPGRPGKGTAGPAVPPYQLTADPQVILKHARRDYDRVVKLPPEFVREKARHSSQAFHAWADCKARSDFPGYAPYLQKHLELARQEAAYLGYAAAPYDYLIDRHDPGMTAAVIGRLFAELKESLVPLMREVVASPVKARTDIFRGFPVEKQRAFLRAVTERLGFNYRRGRIDVSLHPFCEGSAADIRMTTRFDENNPLNSLFSSIHETGHGLYEQGTRLEHQGTALGQAVGMAVHESQSRMWENLVGRSLPFWEHFYPKLKERFPQLSSVPLEKFYKGINKVAPSFIRVEADEATYNLHIMLRLELEIALLEGKVQVRDLPAIWNAKMQEYLGVTPPNDAKGVLQDIHWSIGSIGYFSTYALGNLVSAQLWEKINQDIPDLKEQIRLGKFEALLGWLREKIHRHGAKFEPQELVQKVTGSKIDPAAYLRYLNGKYSAIYGL